MSIDLARRIGRALDVRNETAIRTIDQALQAYVRLTPQSSTTPMTGSIDASQVVSGQFADGRVAQSNVTQHEAALELDALQVATGTFAVERLPAHIESGTYTPTVSAEVNIDASTVIGAQWMRVGDMVTVSGQVNINATTLGALTQFELSLPVAASLASSEQLAGTFSARTSTTQDQGRITAVATPNDTAEFSWLANSTALQALFFIFMYEI